MKHIGWVVSSHGFGHAARSCAVIEAIWRHAPDVHLTIFGRTPDWFFEQSLGTPGQNGDYELVEIDTDLGLVQTSALREDVDATARELRRRLPFDESCRSLAAAIASSGVEAVVCDISPWGLAAALQLGLPSLLVENFTWDWIYAGYPSLAQFEAPFRDAFALATRHVQTQPVCRFQDDAISVTPPASRTSRTPRDAIRSELGVENDDQLVMMTMGGVAWSYEHLDALERETGRVWLIAGGTTSPALEPRGRHVLLPHRSPLYHPDLVAAADVVVGKLGYSTVAEVAAAGTRFVYVPRPHFPESDELEAWTRTNLVSERFAPELLESGDWLSQLRLTVDRIEKRPRRASLPNGADQVAEEVLAL